ncbi:extensin family protein [Aliiroseovarius sp. KMU-50]|uniref:Extensin family protein n=1 Tax=Aliiroseovarius salicola TaxID=3009082 RepID=A0ABT4W619_9RHOB|nr:extensin family protein [Aliiroseovarius sp. KMU-50]MDA5095223.1 extensin family protein [Aliiroseovarius sp. KMU-50]
MIRRGAGYLALAALLTEAAWANAPIRSLRPELRPELHQSGDMVRSTSMVVVHIERTLRPRPRPGSVVIEQPTPVTTARPVSAGAVSVAGFSHTAVARSLRPMLRPASFREVQSVPTVVATTTPAIVPKATGRVGKVCGLRSIRGQKVSAIPGKLRGCGLSEPVKVSEISGVRLSTPAIMDCTTAKALDKWVRNGVAPAIGRLGGGPAELKIAAHYSCRTRNNRPGAKISEHGKGKAVDISGLTLKNGAKISVLKGWRDPVQGKVLKAMHSSACGTFGTVLGPNADRYHKDHLHLDTAKHRGGAYCR